MKAIILVGGQGTRLLSLTTNTPKAMVPVLNKPFLEYIISHLVSHGITDIILAQGHLAQPITEYFGDGSHFGAHFIYTTEDTPLGTGGAVKNAGKWLGDTFLVFNGDTFTDLDISSMIAFHKEKKAELTIATTPTDDPTSYGLIETDSDSRITHFLEKPQWHQVTGNMINAGTYIMSSSVLDLVPKETKTSFEREIFPRLLDKKRPIYAHPSDAYWIDIGKPKSYFELNIDLLLGKSRRYPLKTPNEVILGNGCRLSPTASVTGPVIIGDYCSIGDMASVKGPCVIGNNCRIAEGATIEESVIWNDVEISRDCHIKKAIMANHCLLGSGTTINDSLLSDNVTTADGCRLKSGSRIESGSNIG
jgi:mannose-1-phosphate guanylyltransferase